MRNAFADELTKLGNEDPRVVMLSGDIGNRLFDTFKGRHPSRFFNCGVAEANMMGVAAGMAMNGLRPVTYTIAPFAPGNPWRVVNIVASDGSDPKHNGRSYYAVVHNSRGTDQANAGRTAVAD